MTVDRTATGSRKLEATEPSVSSAARSRGAACRCSSAEGAGLGLRAPRRRRRALLRGGGGGPTTLLLTMLREGGHRGCALAPLPLTHGVRGSGGGLGPRRGHVAVRLGRRRGVPRGLLLPPSLVGSCRRLPPRRPGRRLRRLSWRRGDYPAGRGGGGRFCLRARRRALARGSPPRAPRGPSARLLGLCARGECGGRARGVRVRAGGGGSRAPGVWGGAGCVLVSGTGGGGSGTEGAGEIIGGCCVEAGAGGGGVFRVARGERDAGALPRGELPAASARAV